MGGIHATVRGRTPSATIVGMSNVLATAPAPPEEAARHFAARLAFETDVSDVHADLEAGVPGLVVVDSRSTESWEQGHLPGAVHLPTALIAERAPLLVPRDATVVTYCWGPGCNGATRAALAFARLGHRVKEMIGGYEYWVREGFAFETHAGVQPGRVDPLTAPVAVACAC
jgi:rhodanese-related sulfurtransferase